MQENFTPKAKGGNDAIIIDINASPASISPSFGKTSETLFSARAYLYWKTLTHKERLILLDDLEMNRVSLWLHTKHPHLLDEPVVLEDVIVHIARSFSDYLEWWSHVRNTFGNKKRVTIDRRILKPRI
jgi:hypothetical protein